jgi:hypothetical protein
MTEQDLIDLGFEKQTETPENGGFHYYTLGELLTNDNEAAGVDEWIVTLYGEKYDYHFKEIGAVQALIGLLEEHKVESGFDINNFKV